MDLDDWEVIYTDSDMQKLQTQSELKEIKSYIKSNRLLIKNLFFEITNIMNENQLKLVRSRHFHDFFIYYSDRYIREVCEYFKIDSLDGFNEHVQKEIIRLEDISLAGNNDYMTDIKEICVKFYILVKKLIYVDMTETQSNQLILIFFPLFISVVFE